jgi:uncharacterized membrane protein YGL010W
MSPLRAHMAHYRAEHRTAGCKISHMFGIPAIVASLPMLGWDWRVGLALFIAGWTLQFTGHRFFERNKPVLMANPKNPLTYLSALIFVGEEWCQLLTGRGFASVHDNAPTGSPQPPRPDRVE